MINLDNDNELLDMVRDIKYAIENIDNNIGQITEIYKRINWEKPIHDEDKDDD